MFSEVLRIKPKLDPGDAARMENDLARRFSNVARKFGSGLKAVARGSIIGISLGLIAKLLNPLQELEDKIKSLLGQGSDIRDLADRFHTTPGTLKEIQDVASSRGVTPDQLKDLMSKFASAVEEARLELQDPTATVSTKSQVVQNFANRTDLATAFTDFVKGLQDQRKGDGRDVFFGEKQQRLDAERRARGETLSPEERDQLIKSGLLKHLSGQQAREFSEREVFGDVQFGAPRRFIDTNLSDALKNIHEPAEPTLTKTIAKLSSLGDQQRLIETQNKTTEFISATGQLNSEMIARMEEVARTKAEIETNQLKSFSDLEKAANGIEELKGQMQNIVNFGAQAVGYLGELVGSIRKLGGSRVLRGILDKAGLGGER